MKRLFLILFLLINGVASAVTPSKPTLVSPAAGQIEVLTSSTVFLWNTSTGTPTSYHLQISTSSTFATLAVNDSTITDTTATITSLFDKSTYYWRVRAKNGDGTSAWSDSRLFTTVISVPTRPVFPAGNGTNEKFFRIGKYGGWIYWDYNDSTYKYLAGSDTLTFGRPDTSADFHWLGKHWFQNVVEFDSTMVLDSAQVFRSKNFVSGWAGAGFQLSNEADSTQASLEIDNLTVRGQLSVYELLLRQIRATNGAVFVSASAKVDSVSGNSVWFEDPSNSNLCPFAVGDLLLVQRFKPDGSTSLRSARATVDTLSGRKIVVTYDLNTFQLGDEVVRVGNTVDSTRQNSIYMTSDDNNAPFIDMITGVDSWSAWASASKTKLRIGNLSGIADADFGGALSGYGFFGDNVYLKGKIIFTNTQEVADSLWGKLTYSAAWDSLTGRPTFFDTPSGSGLYLDASHMGYYNGSNWMTYMDMAGNFYLGGTSGALQWNGSTLSITGNVTLTNQLSTSDISGLGDLATQDLTDLNLGDLAFLSLVTKAKLDTTLIVGGYIKTSLINAGTLVIANTQVTGLGGLSTMDSTDLNLGDLSHSDLVSLSMIDTTIIAGGYLKTSLLDVNEIFSKNITATGTITGVTFQTAASGTRVSLSSGGGLQFFASDGTYSTLSQDVSNGLETTGKFRAASGLLTGGSVTATGNFVTTTGYHMGYNFYIVANGSLGSSWEFVDHNANGAFNTSLTVGGNQVATQSWVNSQGFLTSGSFATVATTGDYGDLINTPSIPSATSDLTNDSGFITTSALSGYATETWVSENYLQDGAVYAWALAATKPSYTFSEIGSKPTTISGYGITDAVSTNRTITINGTAQDLSLDRTWTITNISGNAATVTNGVYTTGSYSNPTWITGLAWSKISSVPTASSTVTGVLTSTDWSTFNGKANAFTGVTTTLTVQTGAGTVDLTIVNGVITEIN